MLAQVVLVLEQEVAGAPTHRRRPPSSAAAVLALPTKTIVLEVMVDPEAAVVLLVSGRAATEVGVALRV